jgi:hypothetical protein
MTAEQKQAALTAFGKAYGNAIAQPVGCFGCAVQPFGIILLVWLLTHVSVIWSMLDRIAR